MLRPAQCTPSIRPFLSSNWLAPSNYIAPLPPNPLPSRLRTSIRWLCSFEVLTPPAEPCPVQATASSCGPYLTGDTLRGNASYSRTHKETEADTEKAPVLRISKGTLVPSCAKPKHYSRTRKTRAEVLHKTGHLIFRIGIATGQPAYGYGLSPLPLELCTVPTLPCRPVLFGEEKGCQRSRGGVPGQNRTKARQELLLLLRCCAPPRRTTSTRRIQSTAGSLTLTLPDDPLEQKRYCSPFSAGGAVDRHSACWGWRADDREIRQETRRKARRAAGPHRTC